MACGRLWIVAEALNAGALNCGSADAFVNSLIQAGARYPCGMDGFTQWARKEGLLES